MLRKNRIENVFSFSLFGSLDKYCKGLLCNIHIINEKFPEWFIWVYVGNDVPAHILNSLQTNPTVRVFFTGEIGIINKVYRFFPIDNPSVHICIIRDADSRVYELDEKCIREFISSDRLFHIIRDHPNHFHKIMAGMFGIKKGLLKESLQQSFITWRRDNFSNDFWDDTHFLCNIIYPKVVYASLIHDDLHNFETEYLKLPISTEIGDGSHFIGQVYEYDANGNEFPKFNYFKK